MHWISINTVDIWLVHCSMIFHYISPCHVQIKLHMEKMVELKGLKLLKVIYQLDYRQQLLIRTSHIWIYVPFVSNIQHGPMTVN